jgi:hypothetical protein
MQSRPAIYRPLYSCNGFPGRLSSFFGARISTSLLSDTQNILALIGATNFGLRIAQLIWG